MIPFTQAGLNKITAERDKLLTERPDAVSHLTKAREMGDLSENGYYKESRARLSFIDGRLRYLERLIRSAKIVKSGQVVLDDGIKTITYAIVGEYESDPNQLSISLKSPLGRAIAGKTAGDKISVETPNGIKEYKIIKLALEV